jgi:hypothetical protein
MLLPLIVLLIAASSNAIQLNCNYIDHSWPTSGTIYTCFATVGDTGNRNRSAVTGVSQNHLSGRTNVHVQGIALNDNNLHAMPSNIETFFGNLRAMQIITKLKALTSDDLKPFPRLEVVGFQSNELETIDGDLFQHTPLLLLVNLNDNSLTNIGSDIFTPVPLLKIVHFSRNLCTQDIANSTSEVLTLSLKLRYQCPPSAEMIQRLILNGQELEHKVDEHTAERINPVVYRVNQNEIDQQTLNEQLNARIVELEKIVRELTAMIVTISKI